MVETHHQLILAGRSYIAETTSQNLSGHELIRMPQSYSLVVGAILLGYENPNEYVGMKMRTTPESPHYRNGYIRSQPSS
jgi:hypothetical protein